MPMQVRQKTGWRAPRVMSVGEAVQIIFADQRPDERNQLADAANRIENLERFIEAMMNAISETNPPLALKILNLAGYAWESPNPPSP